MSEEWHPLWPSVLDNAGLFCWGTTAQEVWWESRDGVLFPVWPLSPAKEEE